MNRLTAIGLIATLIGCAAHRPEPKTLNASDYPGVLVSPGVHPGDFLRRQQIVASYPGGKQSFDAVLQKKGDKLTLIGLTPFGTKAFVLEQTGTEVTFKPYLSRELPFPPQFILNDVQRTYFDALPGPPPIDGVRDAERDGERVIEQWSNGRLMRRTFTRLRQDPPGEIAISYGDGMAERSSPKVIELDNGWFGYHLTITTVSEEKL